MHTVSLHDKAFRLKSFLSLTLDLILFFLLTLGIEKQGLTCDCALKLKD